MGRREIDRKRKAADSHELAFLFTHSAAVVTSRVFRPYVGK